MNKVAIVTGAGGQTGSFLCESLLTKGYSVVGVVRRSSRPLPNLSNVVDNDKFKLVNLDICDTSGVFNLIKEYRPEMLFNTAAQSHVGNSFKEPLNTLMVDGYAVVNFLEAIKSESPSTKMLQCSTSEMFGSNVEYDLEKCFTQGDLTTNDFYRKVKAFQNENTPLMANSPYSASKIFAHQMCGLYRKSYNLHINCSICFNHESTRRPVDFVTRKITDGIAQIKTSKATKLVMGNLDAVRDWGHAKEFSEAMILMLQQEVPDDYVIGTGVTASVKEALEYVCSLADLKFEDVYECNPEFMRPSDVPYLCADNSKSREKLGWNPVITWRELLSEMYENDLKKYNGKA